MSDPAGYNIEKSKVDIYISLAFLFDGFIFTNGGGGGMCIHHRQREWNEEGPGFFSSCDSIRSPLEYTQRCRRGGLFGTEHLGLSPMFSTCNTRRQTKIDVSDMLHQHLFMDNSSRSTLSQLHFGAVRALLEGLALFIHFIFLFFYVSHIYFSFWNLPNGMAELWQLSAAQNRPWRNIVIWFPFWLVNLWSNPLIFRFWALWI